MNSEIPTWLNQSQIEKRPQNTRRTKMVFYQIPRISRIPRFNKFEPFCKRFEKDEAKPERQNKSEFLTGHGKTGRRNAGMKAVHLPRTSGLNKLKW
jgi:hypothetical protein